MTELVSVITPNYNSASYVHQTIESVLNQTYKNWELIIVDDKSTDNSVEIIKQYSDSRIKLICLEKNSCAALARNKAIEIASGRFISFIDSDDIWMSNFLEESLLFLKENNVEFVYSSYKIFDENLNPLQNLIGPDSIAYNRLLYSCPILMSTVMYDTNRIGKIMIPLVDKREDYAMFLRLLKKIPRAYQIKKSLAIYRIRKTSYSSNKFLMVVKQFNVYYKFLHLNLAKSLFYTFFWALNGLFKYGKLYISRF